MTGKRSYGDQCGVARSLDLLGERWAVLVVRELLFGPKRFTDLRAGLPGASPDMLAQRLRDLEEAEILVRRKLDPPAAARVYELTDRGRALEPVLIELGRWGSGLPLDPDTVFGADSMLLALKTMFDPAKAGKAAGVYDVRLGDDRFRVEVGEDGLEVERRAAADPTVVIETEVGTLAELLWRGRDLDAAIDGDQIRIEGPKRAVAGFLGLFRM